MKNDKRDDFEKGYDQAIQEAVRHLEQNDNRAAAYELRKVFRRSLGDPAPPTRQQLADRQLGEEIAATYRSKP